MKHLVYTQCNILNIIVLRAKVQSVDKNAIKKNEKVSDIMCPRAYSMFTLHMVSMPLRIIGKLKF